MRSAPTTFLYLNQDGEWPRVHTLHLDVDSQGALGLASLASLEKRENDASENGKARTSNGRPIPQGIAVGTDGTVYFVDPTTDRIIKVDACDGSVSPVPAIGGAGKEPTRLSDPRGLAIHPQRNTMIVADSGNHRIQLFELGTLQLVDVWSGYDTKDAKFEPHSLTVDSDGYTYVVDVANHRVLKLNLDGNEVSSFWSRAIHAWKNTGSQHCNANPSEVAIRRIGTSDVIFVLDAELKAIFALNPDGTPRSDAFDEAGCLKFLNLGIKDPMGLLVTDEAIYVGDNDQRRLLKLRRVVDSKDQPRVIGQAHGFSGSVAGLAPDPNPERGFWLHPGNFGPPLRLNFTGAYVPEGLLWGGPFRVSDRPTAWHRLQALVSPVHDGAHFRFYVYINDRESVCPILPTRDKPRFETDPSKPGAWKAYPADLSDVLIGESSKFLWIGARLEGDGLHSPRIEQIRVDYDHQTYTQYLPDIYTTESRDPAALDRFLSLFESFFVDVERKIDQLACYFDPEAVPADWLDWLAGWLGLGLNEEWPGEQKRLAIAKAFELYGRRGTLAGLREAIHFYTGVDAHIEEPLVNTDWWILPDEKASTRLDQRHSSLGCNTRLISAEPQGAVVGTTAVLDHSHLLRQEEFGAPLFEDTAHQFTVRVRESQVPTADRLNEVREIIEQEKPAHTAYQLCVIEPRLRIGLQSTLGVDTVVGDQPRRPTHLGEAGTEWQMILTGDPPSRLGDDTRIGQSTRLGPDGAF